MSMPTVNHTTCHRYSMRTGKDGEWAVIMLDHTGGLVSIQSDYGDYSHCWSNYGGGTHAEFLGFLCQLSKDYMLTKFVGRPTEFNSKEAADGLRRSIIQCRRKRELMGGSLEPLDREDARMAHVKCQLLEDVFSETEYWIRIHTDPDLVPFMDYAGEHVTVDYSPQAHAFFDRMWPVFTEFWKKEISESQLYQSQSEVNE
jgi:hypothetical protein